MAGINFTNNYDAFRNIQIGGVDVANKVALADEGVCKYKKAEPNPEQTRSVRAAFAQAVKFELTGKYNAGNDAAFQSKKAAVERSAARKEKFFSVMKAIGKYAALAIGTIATAGIGLVVYIEKKKGERQLRDAVQTTIINNEIEGKIQDIGATMGDDDDDDVDDTPTLKMKKNNEVEELPVKKEDEGSVVKEEVVKSVGNEGKLKEYEKDDLIENESKAFFHEINKDITKKKEKVDNKDVDVDNDKELTLEEVARVMDKVETFKTKRRLLREANINAFKGGNPGSLYKDIKGYCKLLFKDPNKLEKEADKNYVNSFWGNTKSLLKGFSAQEINRFKKFYASTLAERMTFIIMTSESTEIQDGLKAWEDDLKLKKQNGAGYQRSKEVKDKMVTALVLALQNAIAQLHNDEVAAHKYR